MELLEHDAKRKVELELMQLREDLEEAGVYTEEQIEDKVDVKRKELMKNVKINIDVDSQTASTHQIAAAKEAELAKMASALGVAKEGKIGEAFDRNLQESRKLERMRAREQREQAEAARELEAAVAAQESDSSSSSSDSDSSDEKKKKKGKEKEKPKEKEKEKEKKVKDERNGDSPKKRPAPPAFDDRRKDKITQYGGDEEDDKRDRRDRRDDRRDERRDERRDDRARVTKYG